ncbi:MAG: hypothetical protein IGR92_05850 [Leptolyngbyaceae cyanobacterium T60_A2020_046]|nr:hypothetical protein [Leptolyngbyaceae cyanobacterium T60_A2020_046]
MQSDIIHTVTSSEESIVLFEITARGQVRSPKPHPQELATKSAQALVQAMGIIQALANRTTETIQRLPQKPSEFELSFGIKIDADAGAIVARGNEEGNLHIKLVWKDDPASARTEGE